MKMKRIDAIIRSSKFNDVASALDELGTSFFTFFEVTGYGKRKELSGTYRGKAYDLDYIRRTKIEIVVEDSKAEEVINTIIQHAHTGQIGDGKVFVLDIEQAFRIRDKSSGPEAL
ncbi:P-II family nitrogen regulator [Rapidithrix thailandica]|uniref:P-II family nitrogen regulator n=1 Tax=Rapidithrix thailandica TaxID=413964 RepID=A0AAW9RVS7_9BACT